MVGLKLCAVSCAMIQHMPLTRLPPASPAKMSILIGERERDAASIAAQPLMLATPPAPSAPTWLPEPPTMIIENGTPPLGRWSVTTTANGEYTSWTHLTIAAHSPGWKPVNSDRLLVCWTIIDFGGVAVASSAPGTIVQPPGQLFR